MAPVAQPAGVPGAAEGELPLGDHATRVLDRPARDPASGADPLVLVHALGLDRLMWAPVIACLPPDRRVIAYDVRGHGRSAGAPPPSTVRDLADDLLRLLDGLGLERVALAGLSMGGAVAQTFAVRHPGRLSALHLVATAADPQPAYLERAARAERHGVAEQLPATLERWFTPAFLAADPVPVRYARTTLAGMGAADFSAGWRALARLDVRSGLAGLRVPVRVIAGADDPATPPAMMRGIAQAIPGAEFEVVPGVRHLVGLEAPERLAAALAREFRHP
ncbi:alpha/beta fold hydrolase [Streptomyces sp. CSDS2]|uniref:alpha/beta fold hydrolase n=1 Tax=Streptomyces sp. CSDS2 TaxID=3055051 RepID=UPI0025AEF992|nr:alpha/beta fold hydrolase [Streptomyces sp. CSDS2]MDN3260907.1 alpha/beta fold hydrolase [Streptomyces sp. CSDS2]